jgi:hypothetical protein
VRDYQKPDGGWHGVRISQEDAGYRDGTPEKNCGQCTMFREPGSCTLVKGKIAATGVCDYFDRE